MIKHLGRFVPAKKVDGKLVPDLSKELVLGKDGLETRGSAPEPAKPDMVIPLETEEEEEK